MPLQVDRRQKGKIRFFYQERGLGPKEIEVKLKEEFGEFDAASRATIVRELRKLRLEREQEFGWRLEEGMLTGTASEISFKARSKKRRKLVKPIPWTAGEQDFSDGDTAIISQVLSKAVAYDMTIPGRTSIALARWIARLHKAYPLQPAIIIWYAAYQAEFIQFLEVSQKIEADYRHIDRCLQFQPWKGDMEESRYNDVCAKEGIGWDRNWWKSHKELFQKAESSITHD